MKTDLSAQYAISTTWPLALGGIIMLAVASYLLFGGKALHALVMREK
jgi:hypothetical protein